MYDNEWKVIKNQLPTKILMSWRIALLFERFTIQVSSLLNFGGGLLNKIYPLRSFWDFPRLGIIGGYYLIHH